MLDLPLMTYVATMSVTPGPNNIMLAASGVNFGFRRTLPHMLGISVGHGVQVVRGFVGAALFQWVNPKAWMMVLNVAILFLPQGAGWAAVALLGLSCAVINLPCIALWAGIGDRMRSLLERPAALRTFNLTMAALLGATAVWILVDELPAGVLA